VGVCVCGVGVCVWGGEERERVSYMFAIPFHRCSFTENRSAERLPEITET